MAGGQVLTRSSAGAELALLILFVLSIGIAFTAAAVVGVAADRYVDDVIAGRAADSWWPGVRDATIAIEQVGLFVAVLLIAVGWYQAGRTHATRGQRGVIGLVLVCAGILLYVLVALWLNAAPAPEDFDTYRLLFRLEALQGIAWPIAILGLGFFSFPRLSAVFS